VRGAEYYEKSIHPLWEGRLTQQRNLTRANILLPLAAALQGLERKSPEGGGYLMPG
jgi:hypothetical protein